MSTPQKNDELEVPSLAELGCFTLEPSGLYWGDTDERKVRISGYVRAIANAQKSGSSAWSTLVEFINIDGVRIRVLIPFTALVGEGDELIRQLSDRGLWVKAGRKFKQRLVEWLSSSIRDLKSDLVLVDRTGWYEKSHFVFPDNAIGSEDQKFYFSGVEKSPFQVAGTLEEWKEKVGRPCSGNSFLCLGVSLALSAPLLRLATRESFGLHFHTSSSSGKTTIAKVAASVWGGPSKDYIKQWRATAVGMEASASLYCDLLLVLDEIGQGDPKEVEKAAYLLGNGSGKLRGTKTAELAKTRDWLITTLSTGEVSLSEHIGKMSRAGQEVRLCDILADAGSEMGVFEAIHGFSEPSKFADHLVLSANACYGAVGRAFIKELIRNPDQILQAIDLTEKRFLGECVIPGASGQISRVGRAFALIAAAGELATEMGLTGWNGGEAFASSKRVFQRWIDARGGQMDREETQAIEVVRGFFQNFGKSRFKSLIDEESSDSTTNRNLSDMAGYKVMYENEVEWRVYSTTFTKDICKGLSLPLVCRTLKRLGLLRISFDNRNSISLFDPASRSNTRFYVVKAKIAEVEL
ncbi:MAG: DUF927 domain-containing protein [Oligoflexia bacterium]|nr:DUF927 domain-containing protein [Oligoflexia bacterium]